MNILISVIVPIFNSEKYLKRCLDSISKQTYKYIEIILINDGSTDNSEKICKQFLNIDSRIKYYKQNNSGVSIARNKGIELATGEYILFVDSDDYLADDAVSIWINLVKEEKADITILESKVLLHNRESYKADKQNELLNTDELKNKLLLDQIGNHMIVKLFRSSLFRGLNFPPNLVYEDLYLMPYLVNNAKKIIYRCKLVYFYNRVNEKSLTSSINDSNAFHRYSKALAYIEHEKIANKLGKNEIVDWSIRHALHEITKAFYINISNKTIKQEELLILKNYALEHIEYIKTMTIKDRILLKSIIKNGNLYKLYGTIYFFIKHK